MDLLQEFLLTASLSLILAFLFSKIASVADRKPPMCVPAAPVPAPAEPLPSDDAPPPASVREVVVCGGSDESGVVEVEVVDAGGVEVPVEETENEVETESEREVERETEKEVEKESEKAQEVEREGERKREIVVEEEEEEEEEEWEGVERSEQGRAFAEAVVFASSEAGVGMLSKLSSEVQMRLYGLQKVAMEGPCYENQPMALKVSARSRWHAWQKLGSMDQEAAMEQYIKLLSTEVPGWNDGKTRVLTESDEVNASLDTGISELTHPHSSLELNKQLLERDRETDSS